MNINNKIDDNLGQNDQALAPAMAQNDLNESDKNSEAIDGCQQRPCSASLGEYVFDDKQRSVMEAMLEVLNARRDGIHDESTCGQRIMELNSAFVLAFGKAS